MHWLKGGVLLADTGYGYLLAYEMIHDLSGGATCSECGTESGTNHFQGIPYWRPLPECFMLLNSPESS